jgi:hypothetical protein
MYRRTVSHPDGQLRYGYETDDGRVRWFTVQLECWVDGEWQPVARFDHDPDAEMGHDVRTEGVHMDVYRNGEKHEVRRDFPRLDPNAALSFAINYLSEHSQRLIERYETWLTK